MKKVIIHEDQKGLLFQNGRFVRPLNAGKYRTYGGRQIETVALDAPLVSNHCTLATLLQNREVAAQVEVVDVADQQLALHFADGKFVGVLHRGQYAFWRDGACHTFRLVSIATPEVADDVPPYIFASLPIREYVRVEVAEYQCGRLFFDSKLVRVLTPGTYYFWRTDVQVDVDLVDTRLRQMTVAGQDILTQDKVNVRVNFVCRYRVTDCVKILTEIEDYEEQLHVTAQLALREYVGGCRLDELLQNREELAAHVLTALKQRAPALYVEIFDAGVKDIILPGEIRDIMNTVLVAEKRAQANVISRREEVASTRSLLNTAKLMEENPTLYKLKELEYIERICENVGNIHLTGSGDLLAQLTAMVGAK